jgi:hypothetical protein
MESFLNFLWVLIAAVALGFWRMRWQPEQRQARRNSLREWTAMGCALVLPTIFTPKPSCPTASRPLEAMRRGVRMQRTMETMLILRPRPFS